MASAQKNANPIINSDIVREGTGILTSISLSGSMELKSEQRGLLSTVEEGAVGNGSSVVSYQSSSSSSSSSAAKSNNDDSSSELTISLNTHRHVYATIATLIVAWVAIAKTASPNTMKAAFDDEQSPYLLGSTGLVPPYKSKGLPSSPSMNNNYLDSDPAPFSLKSPAEIGIDDYIRSMGSRPGKVFGSLRREDAPSYEFNDPNFDVETVPKPAMPTNAWYQSLLVGSVNDGRLGIANRVYTIREYMLSLMKFHDKGLQQALTSHTLTSLLFFVFYSIYFRFHRTNSRS